MKKILLMLMMSGVCYANTTLKQVPAITKEPQVKNEAIVLMYHRIADKNNDMDVYPSLFEQEMKYLYDNHYNVCSSVDLVNAIVHKVQLPPKTIVLTFDDGWKSQEYAMDILQKYKFSGTFALITQVIYDARSGYISRDYIEKYLDEQFVFVNHSRTHDIKDFLVHPEQDVETSKKQLEDVTRNFIPIYVFPYGKHNAELVNAIKKNGYIAAFGVSGIPVNINNTNIYDIPRYLMNNTVSITDFENIVKKTIY